LPIQSVSFGVSGAVLALCVLLLALALGLSVWAYRAPEPPLPRRVRVVLAALRFIALATLILILFQPVMTVSGGGGSKPALPVLLDLSRSMSLPAASSDTVSRLAVAERVLAEALPALDDRFDVRVYGFGADVRELEAAAGTELVAAGGATRLGSALAEVIERRLPAPPPLCLVLSDGGVNAGTDPVTTATRLGVPVYVVAASQDSTVSDIWIAECLANQSAFLGQETGVVVRVGSQLPHAVKTRVLLRDDDGVLRGETVTLPAGTGETEVSLHFVPQRLGTWRLRVEVEPAAVELSAANNHRSLAVEVVEERLQVLLLADEISWDLTFARRALDGDRTLATTVLARLERGSDRYRAVGEGKIGELPSRAREFLPFGAVVLVGVDPSRLPAATRTALRTYVAEGGGVLVLAGRDGDRLRRLLAGELAGLLPVTVQGRGPAGLVAPELTAAGLVHPATSFGASPARAGAVWADLPPVHLSAIVEPALGGDVLVEAEVGPTRRALVVGGPAGGGRALVVPASDIWRWDMLLRGRGQEQTVLRRLLGEAVRWVAQGRRHGNLELFADKAMFLGGERVTVGARLTDDRLQPVDDASVELEIIDEELGGKRVIQLLPAETRGHYTGDAGFLAAGSYRLRGSASRRTESWPAEGGHFMVDDADLDGATPAANPALLRRLAARSGGAVIAASDAASRLVDAAEARRAQVAAIELKLWNHWGVFVICVGALALEWLIRRRHGLA
jgi:hypothetical protein